MTRAPCRVLRGVGHRPTISVSGHGSAAEAGRSRPPGSPVATSGTPRPTHPHEATGTDRRSWCRRPCHRTELGGTPLTPGPVVDERLPPAGSVFTVERQPSAPETTAWRPRRVPDPGRCRIRVGPRELRPTGPQLHPWHAAQPLSFDDMDHRWVVGGISGSSGPSSIRTTADGGAPPSSAVAAHRRASTVDNHSWMNPR